MAQADRRMRAKALNPLGYIGTPGASPGVREAQTMMANLNKVMAREALTARRDLARGIIDEDEFSRRALSAGTKMRAGIQQGLEKLNTLGPIGQHALEQQWNNAGTKASKAFGASFILGKQALGQGGQQAEQYVRQITQSFNQSMAKNKVALAQGLIDPREFNRRGAQASAEFNRALISGTQRLKTQGLLSRDVEQAMINQFKKAGVRAGAAAAEEAARAFRTSQAQLQTIGEGAEQAGRAMTMGITLPVIAMGAGILKSAGDFEKGMNLVLANTGATTAQFAELGVAAREMGQTEFGATKITQGMAQLALAGFNINEIITAMPDIMAMATAGQVDLARAADITTSVLRSQNMEIEDTQRVADVLVKAAIIAQTDLNDLAVAFRYVGAIGNATGQSFEGITAALAGFSQAGFTASFAGTSMRGAITRLLDPTFRASKEIAALNIKIRDASDNMLPFSEIVRQFEDSGIKGAEAIKIFGQRAGPGLASLVALGSERLRFFEANLRSAGGTAEQIRKVQLKGLVGELSFLKAAVQELAIAVGETGLLRAFTGLAIKMTEMIRNLSQANPALFTFLIALATVGATLGPLAFTIGKVLIAFRALRAIMFAAGVASGGIAAVFAPAGVLIVGLAAATYFLWRFIEAQRTANEGSEEFRASVANLSDEHLVRLRKRIFDNIVELEALYKTMKPRLTQGGGQGGRLIEVQTEEMKQIQARVKELRGQWKQVHAQLTETNRVTDEQRQLFADLTAIMNEHSAAFAGADFFQAEERGGGATAADTFLSKVQAAITRLETMKALSQDVTQQTQVLADLQAEATSHIAAGGGHMLASLEYLQASAAILKALDEEQEDSFAKQAQRIAKIMDIKVDLALGDYHAILESLLTLQDKIREAAAAQGLSIEEQYRLAQAARTVRNAIDDVIEKIQENEIPFSHTIDIWETQRAKQEKDFGEAFNALIFRAYDVTREFTSFRSIVQSAALQVGEGLVTAFESIPTPADIVVGALRGLWAGLKIVTGGIGAVIGSLRDFAVALAPGAMLGVLSDGLHQIIGSIASALSPINFFGQVFGQIAQALAPTFDVLAPTMAKFANIMANTINPILEALMPIIEALFPVIQAILRVLAPIIKALLPLFAALIPILEALFPVFKMLAIAATYVAEIFLRVSAVILDVVGFFVKGVGEAIIGIGKLIDLIPGISGRAIINAGKSVRGVGDSLRKAADGARASAKAMARAREEIRNVEIGDALTEVANQFRKFADLNVPEIFKIKLEEFRAIQPDPASAFPRGWIAPNVTPSGASGAAVVDNSVTFGPSSIIIHGTDKSVAQIYEESLAEARRLQQNRTGSTAGTRLF